MRYASVALIFGLATVTGCTQPAPTGSGGPGPAAPTMELGDGVPYQPDWRAYIGRAVTVEGRSGYEKLGPILMLDGPTKHWVYLDGQDWSGGSHSAPADRKRVRVTGTVIARDDMPVIGPGGLREGAAGVGPANTEEETRRLRWRFLLKNATWVVIE